MEINGNLTKKNTNQIWLNFPMIYWLKLDFCRINVLYFIEWINISAILVSHFWQCVDPKFPKISAELLGPNGVSFETGTGHSHWKIIFIYLINNVEMFLTSIWQHSNPIFVPQISNGMRPHWRTPPPDFHSISNPWIAMRVPSKLNCLIHLKEEFTCTKTATTLSHSSSFNLVGLSTIR